MKRRTARPMARVLQWPGIAFTIPYDRGRVRIYQPSTGTDALISRSEAARVIWAIRGALRAKFGGDA